MSEELTKTKLLPIQGKDMDSIMQNLETGVAELFTSERYQEYLKTMSKFHNYSFNNTLLIAMQRPDATLVTGYRNWQSIKLAFWEGYQYKEIAAVFQCSPAAVTLLLQRAFHRLREYLNE